MELSEEEKKALEYLKEHNIPILRYDNYGNILSPLYFGTEEKQTIINLIDKQQKEIDREKQYTDFYEDLCNKQQKEIKKYKNVIRNLNNNWISKEEIREKIKNIEAIYKKEMKPYQTEYGLNLSLLSKKEKEEVINKRNGLLTQKITLEELLEGNENE